MRTPPDRITRLNPRTALAALLTCASLASAASALTAPSNLTAQHPQRFQSFVTLNWQNNGNPGSGYRVVVYRSVNSTADSAYVQLARLPVTTTSYSDFTIFRGSTYRYRVRVEQEQLQPAQTLPVRPGSGTSSPHGLMSGLLFQSSWSNVVSVSYGVMSPPEILDPDAITATSMNMRWRDNTPDEIGFTIERHTVDGQFFAWSTPANVTAHTWTELAADTQYSLRVRAFDGYGSNSAWSNWASRRTLPLALHSLSANSATTSSVVLNWARPSTNGGTDVEINRVIDGQNEVVSSPQVNLTQLTVTNLLPGTTYRFRVRARNASGVTAWSNQVAISTTGQAPPTRLRFQNQSSYPIMSLRINGQEQLGFGETIPVGQTAFLDRPFGNHSVVVTNGPGSLMPFYTMELGTFSLGYGQNLLIAIQNPSIVQIMMNMHISIPRDWLGMSDTGSLLLYRFFTNGYQLVRNLDQQVLEQGTYSLASQPLPGTGVLRVRLTPNGGAGRIVSLDETTRIFIFESGINRGPYQMIP